MANIQQIARREAKRQGVPVNLVLAVIRQESGGRPDAVSPAGAQGVMQLMPATAKALGVRDTSDPAQNIRGGVKYLRQQYDRFKSWKLALAAYNAGPGNVEKHGGVPPFPETRGYVKAVLAAAGDLGAAAPRDTDSGSMTAARPPAANGTPDLADAVFANLTSMSQGRFDPVDALTGISFAAAAQSQPRPVASQPGTSAASSPQPSPAVGYNPQFKSALDRLLEAAAGRVTVTSGYRSPEHQARLWQDALRKYGSEAEARRWVAPPGRSRHNLGVAADLAGPLDRAHALAARFGLTFPLGNENWHIELQGAR